MQDKDREKTATFLNDLYFHNKRNGTFLQAGAYDGIGASPTYTYQKELNWHGLLLQPNYRLIDSIKAHRQGDIILNMGLGDKTQILDFEYLPSRQDSSGFSLTQPQKQHLQRVGFNGQSIKEKVQVFSYQDLMRAFSIKKLDLAVIDVQGYQAKVLHNIVTAEVKPTFMVVQHIYSDKQQLLDIAAKNYNFVKDLGANFIFQRRYTVLIVTRCTRLQNLPIILKSLDAAFKDTMFNFIWYVAVDANRVPKDSFQSLKPLVAADSRNQVLIKYVEHLPIYGHGSDMLNIALFDHFEDTLDFVYTLDDDNVIHSDLLKILYDNIEAQFDMLVVNCQGYVSDNITNLFAPAARCSSTRA